MKSTTTDVENNVTPKPKYDESRIAYELWLTARGSHYYGNALYVAMDMPCIVANPVLRQTVQRYLDGVQMAADHIRLQEVSRLIQSQITC